VVPAIGLDALHGSDFLTTLAGRGPVAGNEIAFGAGTMRKLHLHLGQRVPVTVTGTAAAGQRPKTRLMKVVGMVVLPPSVKARSSPQTWVAARCCGPARCRRHSRRQAAPRQ
jgi:hypothetical protein